ncbi:COP9 signalosome complex subunit 3 [Penicillium roqueforti FM164]|uniref:COP9 signalosome complex subunit 3 n=1 Tax=Penicillium roqueforti (strain FM164) TaxID=1365484 RepID=W6PRS8_PENRF|nr:COP9 signalosome complex subunit 3 [Penicillium roqueforti FM164]
MTLLSDIISASAQLHNSNHPPSDEYDRQVRELVQYFRRLQTTKALDSLANDESFLDRFDPAIDSIPYLFVLHVQIQKAQELNADSFPADIRPSGKLWICAAHFLTSFDGVQVKYAGREWRQLIELVGQVSQAASMASATLVKDAMLRLDPSCAVFTSSHLLLVRLCLEAKAYSCALPVLNKQICHFPISLGSPPSDPSVLCADHGSGVSFMTEDSRISSKLSYRDYLQYFLYGGMVYMALKEWRNALHFLGIVISTPSTNSVSLIMVEAYKKWVLVSLLEKGKLCPPPSITTPHVAKVYQSIARPYIILAHAFERGDLKRLNAEIDAANGVWCADNNLGLVTQVVGAFFSQTVIKLGKTFAALTMVDLSKQVFPSPVSAEVTGSAVSSLIMSRDLNATLVQTKDDAESSMLRFSSIHSLPRLSHELDLQSQLKQEMKLMETMVINLGKTNHNLGLSDEYVDSLHKGQVWSGSSEVNPIVGVEAGLEMDEDLMGDMS